MQITVGFCGLFTLLLFFSPTPDARAETSELTTAVSNLRFDPNESTFAAAERAAKKVQSQGEGLSERDRLALSTLQRLKTWQRVHADVKKCLGSDPGAQTLGENLLAQALASAQKPCACLHKDPACALAADAERVKDQTDAGRERALMVHAREQGLRVSGIGLFQFLARFTPRADALKKTGEVLCEGPCPPERQRILDEALRESETAPPLSITEATRVINEDLKQLNGHVDQIATPEGFGDESLDSYEAKELLQNDYAELLSKPEGRLLLTPHLIGLVHTSETVRAKTSKGETITRPSRFNSVREIDVSLALKDVAQANREFIKDLDALNLNSPTHVHAQLKKMIRMAPAAVAEALLRQPETSDAICKAIAELVVEDQRSQTFNRYINTASGYVETAAWASLALPVGGLMGSAALRFSGGATAHLARLALAMRTPLAVGRQAAQVVVTGGMTAITAAHGYQAQSAYSNYREAFTGFAANAGNDPTAARARQEWETARGILSRASQTALAAGVLMSADQLAYAGIRYGGPMVAGYGTRFFRAAGETTKALLARKDVASAARDLSRINPEALSNVIGAIASVPGAKQTALSTALISLNGDQSEWRGRVERTSAALNESCGDKRPCPAPAVTRALEAHLKTN